MLGELTAAEIDKMLSDNVVGRIGCHDMQETYVVPITYVYQNGSIICHSAEGKKIEMMRSNPRVCFQIDEMTDMRHWRSVIAWGRYEELQGKAAEEAIGVFVHRLAPLLTSETAMPIHVFHHEKFTPADLKSVVFRINFGKKTGRFESSVR
jgi:nitroimidazol reductase NimA-like FMN-containing flavoprotein (pyridoxamine 5'-phosphate oxidase superfamily)